MDYKQPSFYHFTEDSIQLANFVSKEVSGRQIENLLDIGCGCGVIGLEIVRQVENIVAVTFMEPQIEFIKYLNENIDFFLNPKVKRFIINDRISTLSSQNTYDLIVSNPPYFDPFAGKISNDLNKQICRSFMMDSPEIWIQRTIELLSPHGIAYFVIPHQELVWKKCLVQYPGIIGMEQELGRVNIYSINKKQVD